METISKSAKISASQIGEGLKIWDNAALMSSVIGNNVSIGNDSNIVNCQLGDNVVINRRNYINDSNISNFTYTGLNCVINFAEIGKFCSIARNVDIGGFDHRYDCVSTMPIFRLNNMLGGEVLVDKAEKCKIGNDVWIAAGAIILHKCTIGDGAIIGAGAVVTKDVEPYTIVTGIPARPIKKRFSQSIIYALEEICWWNWPIDIINDNRELLFNTHLDLDTISKLYHINESI